MNVDEVLRQFAEGDDLPREAMQWALANWDAAAPRLLARFRAFASGAERTEAGEAQAFYIAHVAGQAKEARAYEPLCRMIASDPELDVWLGDAIDETLPGILINVFEGDLEPLLAALEAPAGDEFARSSALLALGFLVRARSVLEDAPMRALLRRLRREAQPRELSAFWLAWAETAAALGYDDLKVEVALLAKDDLIDAADFGLEDFDAIAEAARGEPDGLGGFRAMGVGPLDDAVGVLESWESDDEEDLEEGVSDEDLPSAPHVNPLRDVGRNDPCPCGSGKKYKKCCLAA